MASLLNRARMTTSTTGTGTVTLGSAVTRFASFAEAGAADATVYQYVIEDGDDFEVGVGTYTSSGTTFSRDTVQLSKIAGVAGTSKIDLSGSAIVSITLLAITADTTTTLRGNGVWISSAIDLIADTASTSGTTVTFSDIGTYDSFVAIFRSVSTSGTTGQISVQVSDDGTNYGTAMNVGTTLSNATFTHVGEVRFYMTGEAATTKYMTAFMASGASLTFTNGIESTENGVTTHIRFTTSAGTFDAGSIALLGINRLA